LAAARERAPGAYLSQPGAAQDVLALSEAGIDVETGGRRA